MNKTAESSTSNSLLNSKAKHSVISVVGSGQPNRGKETFNLTCTYILTVIALLKFI